MWKITSFFSLKKCLFLWLTPMFLISKKCASHFCRVANNEKKDLRLIYIESDKGLPFNRRKVVNRLTWLEKKPKPTCTVRNLKIYLNRFYIVIKRSFKIFFIVINALLMKEKYKLIKYKNYSYVILYDGYSCWKF